MWEPGTPDLENHGYFWVSPKRKFRVGVVLGSDRSSMDCGVLDSCRCLTFALERSEGEQLPLAQATITMYMDIASVCDGTSSAACLQRSCSGGCCSKQVAPCRERSSNNMHFQALALPAAPWPEHWLRLRCARSSFASCQAHMTQMKKWHPTASAPLPRGPRTKQKGEHHLRVPLRGSL